MHIVDPHIDIEIHPLQPFLPAGARLLLLGSFPPPRARWCMDFFYPNPQNDMWRIIGQVFYGDKMRFVEKRVRTTTLKGQESMTMFRYEAIVEFCTEKGIAIYDTAQSVRRLQGNAADEHLEIIEPTDIAALLRQIPDCHDICCTGQKAADTLTEQLGCNVPKVGSYVEVQFPVHENANANHRITAEQPLTTRHLRFWRMPSSSRAYPLSIDNKAAAYQHMMQTIGMV